VTVMRLPETVMLVIVGRRGAVGVTMTDRAPSPKAIRAWTERR
jgi:hypothetical protein